MRDVDEARLRIFDLIDGDGGIDLGDGEVDMGEAEVDRGEAEVGIGEANFDLTNEPKTPSPPE